MPFHLTSTIEDGNTPGRPVFFLAPPPPVWPSFGQQGELIMAESQRQAKTLENANDPHIRRHPRYYLKAGDLHFLVGRYLFRVHRHFFESQSSYFRNLLAPCPFGSARGADDASAVILDDVLAAEFECFLTVFYAPQYTVTSKEDWLLILELADHWNFPEVKKAAVHAMERLRIPEVDRIVAYQTYDIGHSYILPLFAALVARHEPLSPEEGEQLGMQTAIRVAQLREAARSKTTQTSPDAESGTLRSIIRDTFKLPVNPMRNGGSTASSSSSSLSSDI